VRSDQIPDTPQFWDRLEERLRAEMLGMGRRSRLAVAWDSMLAALRRPVRIAMRQGLVHVLASLAVVSAVFVPVLNQGERFMGGADVGGNTGFIAWEVDESVLLPSPDGRGPAGADQPQVMATAVPTWVRTVRTDQTILSAWDPAESPWSDLRALKPQIPARFVFVIGNYPAS